MAKLVVQAWHTECDDCGYGSGGYTAAAHGKDVPALTPEHFGKKCYGCGEVFTERWWPYQNLFEELDPEASLPNSP
jgi:hypothetical protein